MLLYKVRQRLGAVPPDPRVLDLQPLETPFEKSWVRPGKYSYTVTYGLISATKTNPLVIDS